MDSLGEAEKSFFSVFDTFQVQVVVFGSQFSYRQIAKVHVTACSRRLFELIQFVI